MFKSQDPQERDRQLHWTHDNVKGGTGFNAWIAGYMVGVLCHWNYRSIPCWNLLTGGGLECPYKHDTATLHWVGYLPLYSDSHRPTVVVIRAANKEPVEKLRIHEAVYVSRGEKRGATVNVQAKKWASMWTPPRGFKGPPDIREWLLKFWKEPELRNWVLAHPVTDSPVSQATGVAPQEDGGATQNGRLAPYVDENDPAVRALRGVMDRSPRLPSSDDSPVSLAEAMPSLNGRHAKPSGNGTHSKGEG